MYKSLGTGHLGVRGLSIPQQIELARTAGFDAIDVSITEVAELARSLGEKKLSALFRDSGVRPGPWGLPVAWTRDDQWEKDLEALPALAALARSLGATRTATWCMSGSNERVFDANLRWHADRFRPIARVLAAHGCRLGIEFLGPRTIRAQFRHTFIHTLGGMLDLAREIGTGNVGLLLDAYHLHTSGDPMEVLDTIRAADVVTVHVNDAPTGLTLDTYLDQDRRLPMETGVIDLGSFIRKLAKIGYDGPVTAEPFSKAVNEIGARDPAEAVRVTAQHMDRMWKAGGLT